MPNPEALAHNFEEIAEKCRQEVGDADEIDKRNNQLREQILEKIRKRESLQQDMLEMQKYVQVKAEIAKCRTKHDEMVQRFAELEAKKNRRREVLAKIEELAGRSVVMKTDKQPASCWLTTTREQTANEIEANLTEKKTEER
ncbi:unnamed protein product [Oikopleura dioica]|uniref:Uncharacterized protein n=1 Tax=Oikopleura dioica TaxID=34765 RepID=E4XRE5_OIKDI|nr:unnamed protein product [Oikopleura dioica]